MRYTKEQQVVITEFIYTHDFEIGEVVTILEVSEYNYLVINDAGLQGYVVDEEIDGRE